MCELCTPLYAVRIRRGARAEGRYNYIRHTLFFGRVLGLRYNALATLHTHKLLSLESTRPLPLSPRNHLVVLLMLCLLSTQWTHAPILVSDVTVGPSSKVMQVAPIKYKTASRSSAQRAAATKLQRLAVKLVTCAQLFEAGS